MAFLLSSRSLSSWASVGWARFVVEGWRRRRWRTLSAAVSCSSESGIPPPALRRMAVSSSSVGSFGAGGSSDAVEPLAGALSFVDPDVAAFCACVCVCPPPEAPLAGPSLLLADAAEVGCVFVAPAASLAASFGLDSRGAAAENCRFGEVRKGVLRSKTS